MTLPGTPLVPTPDDTQGHLTPVWDETSRPHFISAQHTGPSPRGQAAAQSLIDVHHQLRDQLAKVRALIDDVTDGTATPQSARTMLHEMSRREDEWRIGAYCASYCTLVAQHHYGEDVEIFPMLLSDDGGLGPVLDRLEQEHVVVHGLLERVDAALVSLVDDNSDHDELRQFVNILAEALLSHLAYEENELVAPMARAFG